jgi:uncharacterized membrane protein (GlpM family)
VRLLPSPWPRAEASHPPRWDLPVRAVVATALVVLLTAAATALGPRLTGLLAVFPVYAAVLATFARRHGGPAGALPVLHGVALGLLSFATFFFVLAALLGRIGSVAAFTCAAAAALAVQAASYRRVRTPAV